MKDYQFRYGRFQASNHIVSLIGVTVMLAVGIYGMVRPNSLLLVSIGWFLMASFLLLITVFPYFEKFSIKKDQIKTIKLWKKDKVNIPERVVIIVSPAHIAPLNSIQSVELKGVPALSIVLPEKPEQLLETIHGKDQHGRYTNISIERRLEWKFIYSFAMTEELLDKILSLYDVEKIIVPESLSEKLAIDRQRYDVFIDKGY